MVDEMHEDTILRPLHRLLHDKMFEVLRVRKTGILIDKIFEESNVFNRELHIKTLRDVKSADMKIRIKIKIINIKCNKHMIQQHHLHIKIVHLLIVIMDITMFKTIT